MSKIPKIEDYLRERVYTTKDGIEDIHDSMYNVSSNVKELIILHVKAALKSRDELYEIYYAEDIEFTEENKDFIRKSYPLENIK